MLLSVSVYDRESVYRSRGESCGSCCIRASGGEGNNNPSTASNWQRLRFHMQLFAVTMSVSTAAAVPDGDSRVRLRAGPNHNCLPAVARKPICHRSHLRLCLQLLLGLLGLQLWPSHLTRPRVWLAAAHALIIAGQLRSTWSHDQMALQSNGQAPEQGA